MYFITNFTLSDDETNLEHNIQVHSNILKNTKHLEKNGQYSCWTDVLRTNTMLFLQEKEKMALSVQKWEIGTNPVIHGLGLLMTIRTLLLSVQPWSHKWAGICCMEFGFGLQKDKMVYNHYCGTFIHGFLVSFMFIFYIILTVFYM